MRSLRLTVGVLLVSVTVLAGVAAAPPIPAVGEIDETGIEINGLLWGDGDYLDYTLLASADNDRGFLYAHSLSDTAHVLVRVSFRVNDNAFEPSPKTSYLDMIGSLQEYEDLGWPQGKGHTLADLIASDHLQIIMRCGEGNDAWAYSWIHDLVYDANSDPAYDWRSDQYGPDGRTVTSSDPANHPVPSTGVVIDSHSSLEYNLENSSWILINQASQSTNYEDWMSLDVDPLGQLEAVVPVSDPNAITGEHEDYPFFASTGGAPTDLFEWSVNYEMTLDLSACGSENVYITVPSAHNSPAKSGSEDVEIPPTPLRTDAEAPVWEVPDDIVVDTDPGQATATVTYSAVATDNVGVVSSSCEPPSGATFNLGTTTVDCTASDSAGNVGTASFDVTVIDSEAPVWNVPSDISVSASDLDGATVFYQATASDNVAVVSSSCTPPSGDTFPVGTTTVDCTASDAVGNIGSATFDVTVTASVDTLVVEIENLDLDRGAENSLSGPLQVIEALVTDADPDNDTAACQLLDVFTMNVARRHDNGSLTQADADALTAFAQALRSQYNC